MPVYEYECPKCGCRFEIKQAYDSEVVIRCPNCEGKARRLISIVNHKKVIEG